MDQRRTWLDLGIIGGLFVCAVGSYLVSRHMPEYQKGDIGCGMAKEAHHLDKAVEGQAWSYSLELRRVASSLEVPAAFWVLYGKKIDPESEMESARVPASPSEGQFDDMEPIAFLRDDNSDSHPDTAVLFDANKELPSLYSLHGKVWSQEEGCYFWKKPVARFLKWALDEHGWVPGRAYGHAWSPFLERLSQFWFDEKSQGVEGSMLARRPSTVNVQMAGRVFELLSSSIADSGLEGVSDSDDSYLQKTQFFSFELLNWIGFQVDSVRGHPKQELINVEGFQKPLKVKSYKAPMLYVEDEDGPREKAVFDVLLFNRWTSQQEWAERLSQRVE